MAERTRTRCHISRMGSRKDPSVSTISSEEPEARSVLDKLLANLQGTNSPCS